MDYPIDIVDEFGNKFTDCVVNSPGLQNFIQYLKEESILGRIILHMNSSNCFCQNGGKGKYE